jgi:hypothetical protein
VREVAAGGIAQATVAGGETWVGDGRLRGFGGQGERTFEALPFEPLVPNADMIAAMREARGGKLPLIKSVDALFKDLNADDWPQADDDVGGFGEVEGEAE